MSKYKLSYRNYKGEIITHTLNDNKSVTIADVKFKDKIPEDTEIKIEEIKEPRKLIQCSENHNLNAPAAIAIITSGNLVRFHDLIQLCIIPLDNMFEVATVASPFLATFQPIHSDHPWIGTELYSKAKMTGLHPSIAQDVLETWFQRLPIVKGKQLIPVCHQWDFASAFIKELVGPTLYEEVFFEAGRDLSSIAGYINDSCAMQIEPVPMARYQMGPICAKLGVQINEPKDALNLAQATRLAYKAMLRRSYRGQIL